MANWDNTSFQEFLEQELIDKLNEVMPDNPKPYISNDFRYPLTQEEKDKMRQDASESANENYGYAACFVSYLGSNNNDLVGNIKINQKNTQLYCFLFAKESRTKVFQMANILTQVATSLDYTLKSEFFKPTKDQNLNVFYAEILLEKRKTIQPEII